MILPRLFYTTLAAGTAVFAAHDLVAASRGYASFGDLLIWAWSGFICCAMAAACEGEPERDKGTKR